MKAVSKKYTLLQVIFLLMSLAVSAQDDWEEGGLKDAQLVIEKNRVLELASANRNFDRMTKIEAPQPGTDQDFIVRKFNFLLPQLAPPLRPMKMKTTPVEKLYGNYVKAGFGNYVTPYLEGFFNSTRSERYSYGARIRHLSSARGPVDGRNSGNSFNDINLNGKYFTGVGNLSGALNYQRRGVHFYGYNENDFEPERDSIRQTLSFINLEARYQSAQLDNPINYGIGTSYHYFWDRYEARESDFNVNFDSKVRFGENSNLSIRADISMLQRKDSALTSRNLIVLYPAYSQKLGKLNFSIGMRMAYNGEPRMTLSSDTTAEENNRFRFYPAITAGFDILQDKLTAYGSLQGTTQKTTLRTFTEENPFLQPNVPLLHTNQQIEFQAGIRGNVMRKLGFNVRASYGRYKNLYFYNNSFDTTKFTVLYDQKSIPVLNLTSEFSVSTADLRVLFKSEFFNYGVRSLEYAWHRPTIINTLSTAYHYRNKVFVNFDVFHLGGIRAKNYLTDTNYRLKPIIDLNLKADYHFSEILSVFVSGNNLLSRKYERYLHYPSRGFNVLAGVTFAF